MGVSFFQIFVFLLVVSCSAISVSIAFLSHNTPRRRQGISSTRYSVTTCHAAKEKWFDEQDEDVSYQTRYNNDDDRARELQDLRYESDDETLDIVRDDYYYEDEGDEYYEEEDMYIEETSVDEELDPPIGNFWYNPKQGVDPLPSKQRRRKPSKLEEKNDFHAERRPRPRPKGTSRKTTFRSGEPKTPEPVADFYDRLFWYGFNPDESIAPGDKTLFGGTKGKFNGLDFFKDDERQRKKKRKARRKPPQQFRADAWYDDIMDSLDTYEEDEYVDEVEVSKTVTRKSVPDDKESIPPRRPRSLPPEETYFSYDEDEIVEDDGEDDIDEEDVIRSESVKRQPSAEVSTRRPRPRPREDVYYEEETYKRRRPRNTQRRPASKRKSGDRIAEQVSTWFGPDDEDYGRAQRPRRRQRQYDDDDDEPWSITNVLDGIFGVNRKETNMNAAMYNKQMGLDRSGRSQRRPSERRRRSNVEGRRETASTYRKEEEDDLDDIDVVDVDVIIEEQDDTAKPKRRRERTVEERAAAFERVPPSGVPAWGPSGAVGVDARTKATLDALEEIREATRKVELKEQECIEAKEDLVISKADFALQKKRLLANLDDPDQIRSSLRQMKMQVQDAALNLRRCRAELEVARDRLADLQDRNWALLSLYDADKAFQEVVETFREFEESERLETIRVSDELAEQIDMKPNESSNGVNVDSNGKEAPANDSDGGEAPDTGSTEATS